MKTIRMIAAATLLLWGAGCLKVDQSLTIRPDGSVMVEYTYGMAENMIAQMEAMSKMGQQMGADEEDDGTDFTFDEAEVRKQFEKMKPEGIHLEAISSEVKDGWKYMTVRYSADSLTALSEAEAYGGGGMSLTRNDAGNYVLIQESTDFGQDDDETPEEMKAMMMQQMLPMMAGMRIAIHIEVPTRIIEANGQVAGNRVSWVYDVDKDPSFITDSMPDMKLVFDGKGLSLPTIVAD